MGESHSVSFTAEEAQTVQAAVTEARASGKNVREAARAALGPAPEDHAEAPVGGEAKPPVRPTDSEAPPILGKFKTQADLEKAYKELEAKLGAPKTVETPRLPPIP